MNIFEARDYRKFVLEKIRSYPNDGYGVQARLAKFIEMHSSSLNTVLTGQRDLTPEQALSTAEFFSLNNLEKEYFVMLVDYSRAGTKKLREYYKEKMESLKEKAAGLRDRPNTSTELPEEAKALFYSDWRYSAIRVASFLPEMSVEKIADSLNITTESVNRILDFLVLHGLVLKDKGIVRSGPNFTRVRPNNPLVASHHTNWRLKALEEFRNQRPDNLHVTAPLALGADDAQKIKGLFSKAVEDVLAVVEPSPPEEMWCVNLDWFNIGKK